VFATESSFDRANPPRVSGRGRPWSSRTRIDGTEGARIWTGHDVLAHNLVKISALAA